MECRNSCRVRVAALLEGSAGDATGTGWAEDGILCPNVQNSPARSRRARMAPAGQLSKRLGLIYCSAPRTAIYPSPAMTERFKRDLRIARRANPSLPNEILARRPDRKFVLQKGPCLAT